MITARICQKLLAGVGLSHLWTSTGPTPAAIALQIDADEVPEPAATMIRVAWAAWNGCAGTSLGRILEVLDAPNTELVAGYLRALARNELLYWADQPWPPPRRSPGSDGDELAAMIRRRLGGRVTPVEQELLDHLTDRDLDTLWGMLLRARQPAEEGHGRKHNRGRFRGRR